MPLAHLVLCPRHRFRLPRPPPWTAPFLLVNGSSQCSADSVPLLTSSNPRSAEPQLWLTISILVRMRRYANVPIVFPPQNRRIIDAQVDDMLHSNVIQPSSSPYLMT